MTRLADCASNISHDERILPWCHPPQTNIDAAEAVTAKDLRGVCIVAAGAASPVSKLITSTVLQTSVVLPPMLYNLPELKQHQTTIPSKLALSCLRKELMQNVALD